MLAKRTPRKRERAERVSREEAGRRLRLGWSAAEEAARARAEPEAPMRTASGRSQKVRSAPSQLPRRKTAVKWALPRERRARRLPARRMRALLARWIQSRWVKIHVRVDHHSPRRRESRLTAPGGMESGEECGRRSARREAVPRRRARETVRAEGPRADGAGGSARMVGWWRTMEEN
jgi:hypothetical protein